MKFNLTLFLSELFILLLFSCERLDPKDPSSETQVYIPDYKFLRELIDDQIDTNGDQSISSSEAECVTFLNLSNYFDSDITDLTGIEAFINLKILVCRCNKISNLDLSSNTKLEEVYAYDNDLQNIDVSGCKDLVLLHVGYDGVCNKNRLTKLDISNNHKLKTLNCSYNLLTEIDVSNNPRLESLNCQVNQIFALDLSNNPLLYQLEVWTNQLVSLDVSSCISLTKLNFAVNQIAEIALENNPLLEKLNASKNLLSTLDVSKNPALKVLIINDMPSLKCVCVESLSPTTAEMNIFSTENTPFQLTADCI